MGRTIITVHEISRGDITYDKNKINSLIEYYGCPHHGFLFVLIFASGLNSVLVAMFLKDNSCLDNEYALTPRLASDIYFLGIILIGISMYKLFINFQARFGDREWVEFSLLKYNPFFFIAFCFSATIICLTILLMIFNNDFLCIYDEHIIIVRTFISIIMLCIFQPLHNMMKTYSIGLLCEDRFLNS